MRDFIDVVGASGQSYRFRALPNPTSPPRLAGNFLFVRAGLDDPVVVGSGSSNDLSLAKSLWPAAERDHFAEATYIHLNIARSERSKVQADIVDRHAPMIVATDFDLTGEAVVTTPQTPKAHAAAG